MEKRIVFKISLIFVCLSLSSCATFSDCRKYYRQAYQEAKNERMDAAFMKLLVLLSEDPKSPYAPRAAFAVAEYYLDKNDFKDAAVSFYKYIRDYPNDSGVIFAELIIYKITKQAAPDEISLKEQDLLAKIRKKIFAKPMFFIFFDKRKSFSYRSMFDNLYTAFDYVDKVKVMRNEKILFELSP